MTSVKQDYIRYLSDDRIADLKEIPSLKKLLDIIKTDPEQRYQFEIRQNRFTVYYKGGKLSNFKKNKKGEYTTDFDLKYCNNQSGESVNRERLIQIGNKNIAEFVADLSLYTAEMDAWFIKNPKAERANQQIICKKFRKSGEHLWLLDIEFVAENSRFDMLAADNDGNIKLIELKVGNNALSSVTQSGSAKLKPGLYKHYLDFLKVKNTAYLNKAVILSAQNIINVRKKLGLPTYGGELNTDADSLGFEIWLADYRDSGRNVLRREIEMIEQVGGSANSVKINPDYLTEIKKHYSAQ